MGGVGKFTALVLALLLVFIPAFFTATTPAYAATSPSLGTAASYSITAGTSVTNAGASTVSGSIGISPGAGGSPNYTGFTGGNTVTLGGSINDANAAALTAMADRTTAYTALASQGCDTDYGGGRKDLAGLTLVPGVYCVAGGFDLTGTLTLNGDADDVWIFKSAGNLILTGGTAVKVLFTGGGNACNVWWRVVSTATFDANSTFVGNILADTSITLAAGASLNGRALARTAEVTLSSNSITGPTCSAGAGAGAGIDGVVGGMSSSSQALTAAGGSGGSAAPYCPPLASTIVAPFVIESRRISPTSIFLSWGPSSGTNLFNIQYGFEHGKWLYNTDVDGFSTTINDLPPNQPIWVQIAGRSTCRIGGYGVSKLIGGPKLPNTGVAPAENNVPWYLPVGIFGGISILIVFAQRKNRFSSKS